MIEQLDLARLQQSLAGSPLAEWADDLPAHVFSDLALMDRAEL